MPFIGAFVSNRSSGNRNRYIHQRQRDIFNSPQHTDEDESIASLCLWSAAGIRITMTWHFIPLIVQCPLFIFDFLCTEKWAPLSPHEHFFLCKRLHGEIKGRWQPWHGHGLQAAVAAASCSVVSMPIFSQLDAFIAHVKAGNSPTNTERIDTKAYQHQLLRLNLTGTRACLTDLSIRLLALKRAVNMVCLCPSTCQLSRA